MGGGASRTETEKVTPLEKAKRIWLDSRNKAVAQVKLLNQVGLHKQIANRILEPWLHIRIILSGTEFENWFALRVHKDAQPEICALATKMLELYNASEPKYLKDGEWHIPFGDNFNKENLHALNVQTFGLTKSAVYYYKQEEELKKKIAVARCARISYLNFEGKDDYSADIKLCDRLFANNPKHLSPTEHVAQAQGNSDWSGNFKGFKQFRKFFPQENLTDPRVINKFKL
jgi:thymidylate synthase ThyX